MKKFTLLTAALLFTLSVLAQSPQKMSYQSVVRNATGTLVTNQAIGIKISILQGSVTGTVVFTETYNPNPQTNSNGLVTVEIGSGTALTGSFSGIDWALGPYFLKTETDPAGGTNYTISGTSQLLSVPYALYAKSAANGFSGNYNDLTNKPVLFSGSYPDLTNKPVLFDGAWASLTGKPTTLSGYGITDAMSISHAANNITTTNITNWNTAFGWGNHSGLYRPITYVPTWSEVTGKPTTVAGYGITDAVNTTGNQTIAGIKTFTGTVNASNNVISNVGTPVSNNDAATKAYVDALEAKLRSINAGGFLTDIDGNTYNLLQIGTQIWMAENLKTKKYNDGSTIAYPGSDKTTWINNTSGAYAWYNDNESANKDIYGALYNWYAVKTGKLCPTGWHVPTQQDFNTLEIYMIANGYNYDGSTTGSKIGKALASASLWWLSSFTGAVGNTDYPKNRNLSGFNGLPAGNRNGPSGNYGLLGGMAYWWSATADPGNPTVAAIARRLDYNFSEFILGSHTLDHGFSVRCLKD